MLTRRAADHYIDASMKHEPPTAFFLKSDPPDVIIDGIRKVSQDHPVFGDGVQDRLHHMHSSDGGTAVCSRLQNLSPRELEVLRLIGKGLSRADTATTVSAV